MSTIETQRNEAVPSDLSNTLMYELGRADLLTGQLGNITNQLIAADLIEDITETERLEYKRSLLSLRDDRQMDVAQLHSMLIKDVYDARKELTGWQMIFFDTLIKTISGDHGFSFEVAEAQTEAFKRLTHLRKVIFVETAVVNPDKDPIEKVLHGFPKVSLEFDEDEYTLDALVTYSFTMGKPISTRWNDEYVVIGLSRRPN